MKNTYGRVRLDASGIQILKSIVDEVLKENASAIRNTNDQDEIIFYRTTAEWLKKLQSRFEVLAPGRIGFTEEELRNMKGLVVWKKTGLLKDYQSAAIWTDAHRARDLTEEIEHLEKLVTGLEKPFLNDRSQDAEEEEDLAEDATDDDAPNPRT